MITFRHAVYAVILAVSSPMLVKAEIHKAIIPPDTIANGVPSAFAFDATAGKYICSGEGVGGDLRIGEILDDSSSPWSVSSTVLMNNFQRSIFSKAGRQGQTASFAHYGANYSYLDGAYLLYGDAILYQSGSLRSVSEPDICMCNPGLPDSPVVVPTNCSVSNIGGIFTLIDTNLDISNGFVASGVQVGHRITVFPVGIVDVNAGVYSITEVVGETELRLDHDPCGYPSTVVDNIGYVLSLQPHVRLSAFRQKLSYFSENLSEGPLFQNEGAIGEAGNTLYIGETITDNIIAVDTGTADSFDVFVDTATLQGYVQEQVSAGRWVAGSKLRIYTDFIYRFWRHLSPDCTVEVRSSEQVKSGTRSLKCTFDEASAELTFICREGTASTFSSMSTLDFWIHGGVSGGQVVSVSLGEAVDEGGEETYCGLFYTLSSLANEWTHVSIPVTAFVDPNDPQEFANRLIFRNDTQASQAPFYLDEICVKWNGNATAGITYDTSKARLDGTQYAMDDDGRLWFVEGETDDIVYTEDGEEIQTFLTSNVIAEQLALFPSGVVPRVHEVAGLAVDPMGTVYWADLLNLAIYKAPSALPTNIVVLATKDELISALGLGSEKPAGLGAFEIRDGKLLSYNEGTSGNRFIFSIDLETSDYCDFDGDYNVDEDDYTVFQCCLFYGVTSTPCECTESDFNGADLNDDGSVDLLDYSDFTILYTD